MKLGAVSARQTVMPSGRLHKRSEGRRYELRLASALQAESAERRRWTAIKKQRADSA